MAEPPFSERAANYQAKTEKVTHGPQIVGLLRRLRDQRVLLSVRVPGHDQVFNSLLLDVDPEGDVILFDELTPHAGHRLVAQVGKVHVHCQCQGVELSFVSAVEVGQDGSGISYYRSRLPASVNYLQRRSHYRVRLGRDLEVPIQLLKRGDTGATGGTLFDLSMGGIGAVLDSALKLELGDIFDCAVQLPKGDALQIEVEMRFIRVETEKSVQRVGASFCSLEPTQEHSLRRFVAQLEREMVRRKART